MRNTIMPSILILAVMLLTATAMAGEAVRSRFGTLPDGRHVEAVTLSNQQGMQVRLIAWGAAIQSVLVPDRDGILADVALGHSTLEEYLQKSEYFGATVGRVANRIAHGRFVLDETTYTVPVNNGPHSLHGGNHGFDKVLWDITDVSQGAQSSVSFRYISPDGDQGYPGTLTTDVTYTLDAHHALSIHYRATSDRTTVVNLSNHAYWNLEGEGARQGAMEHLLMIPAEYYLPTDATSIPTGEFRKVDGTVFDFRNLTPVGARVRDACDQQIAFARGYDHTWVIHREGRRSGNLRRVARVEAPVSGRVMDVLSDQPGVQFYSGNFFDGTTLGKSGRAYRMGDAIVLEPQMFPDTPNHLHWGRSAWSLDASITTILCFVLQPALRTDPKPYWLLRSLS